MFPSLDVESRTLILWIGFNLFTDNKSSNLKNNLSSFTAQICTDSNQQEASKSTGGDEYSLTQRKLSQHTMSCKCRGQEEEEEELRP